MHLTRKSLKQKKLTGNPFYKYISIVLMLVMMRAQVKILAPITRLPLGIKQVIYRKVQLVLL